jgi:hypothetical protein
MHVDCVLAAVDKAFSSSNVYVGSLRQADSRKVVQYHASVPAKPAEQLQSGTKATLLSGHDVKVAVGARCGRDQGRMMHKSFNGQGSGGLEALQKTSSQSG